MALLLGQTHNWLQTSTYSHLVENRGRMQVNKALHTCTSWCAYAAMGAPMFGSSADKHAKVKHRHNSNLALVFA